MGFNALPKRKVIKGISFVLDAFGCYKPENLECLPARIRIRIRKPADCLPLFENVRNRRQECFVALTLDGVNQVIKSHEITVGLANQCQVHPRETYARAVEDRAVGLIIAHNHPSGSLDPSTDDLVTTRRLADAGRLMGITLYDHIIVAETGWISLRERFPDYFQRGALDGTDKYS